MFRKKALRRLETPEQLDRTLIVIRPMSWLALAVLATAAAAVLYWAIFGQVSTYVQASGIFINRGSKIVDVASLSPGILTEISYRVGDEVKEGQVLATIANEETTERYRNSLVVVKEREEALERQQSIVDKKILLEKKNYKSQLEQLQQLEASSRKLLETARQRFGEHRQLFEEKIITHASFSNSEQAFERAQRELFNIINRKEDLNFKHLHRMHELETSVFDAETRVAAAKRQVGEFRAQLDSHEILAPAPGRVSELKAVAGAVLRPGQAILSIELSGEKLDMLIYIPPADGKRVKQDMRALVSPVTARREEFGVILGTVSSISDFPVTLEGILAVLNNRELARTFMQGGSPFEGHVELEDDPSHPSGFAWTSPKATDVALSSGTLANIEIIVESKPPIALVVPLIKKMFGIKT